MLCSGQDRRERGAGGARTPLPQSPFPEAKKNFVLKIEKHKILTCE